MSAIDISRYQGTVDFAAVKASGVGLVIAKMGGGDSGQYVDSKWIANRNGIRAAGLKLGSYFFNGPGSTPTTAADFQFANIDYRPGDLVVIDVEGSVAWSPAQVLEWAQRMISHGVPAANVGVYMSASVLARDWSAVANLGTFLWVASYGMNTGAPGRPPAARWWDSWALWQYTSNGSVPGITGRVDLSQISPAWASTNITPLGNSSIGEREMLGLTMASVGASFTLTSTGRLIHHIIEKNADGTAYPRETTLVGSALQQPSGSMWVESDDDFARLLWGVGRFDLGNAAGIQLIKDTIKTDPGHVFEPPAAPVTVALTDAQLATIAAAVKVPAPDMSTVTVNAQVDVMPELVAALKDPTVLAALAAAIKVPTKIESTLS